MELVELPRAAREDRIQLWQQSDYEAGLEALESEVLAKEIAEKMDKWVRGWCGTLRFRGGSGR